MAEKQNSIVLTFLKNEEGATAIEYGLIAALVATAIITGIQALGTANQDMYDNLTATIVGAGVG